MQKILSPEIVFFKRQKIVSVFCFISMLRQTYQPFLLFEAKQTKSNKPNSLKKEQNED